MPSMTRVSGPLKPGPKPSRQVIVRLALGGAGGLRAVVRQAELHVRRRDGDGEGERERADDEQQRAAGDQRGPAGAHLRAGGVAAAGVVAEHAVRAAQALAEDAEQGREEGDGDEHRDGDRAGRGQTHDREERDVDDEQADEGDDHRHAGEDDGAARGGDGLCGRLARRQAVVQALAVAREDEERVVDADGEAEHRGERRRGVGDLDEAGDGGEAHHADDDADHRRQQRQARGQQRGQRDGEDEEADGDADGLGGGVRLGRDHAARPLDLHPGRLGGRGAGLELILGLRLEVGRRDGIAHVGEADRAVGRDRAGRVRVDDADDVGARARLLERGHDPCLDGGVVEGGALGRHEDHARVGARGRRELVLEQLLRLLRLGARHREAVVRLA